MFSLFSTIASYQCTSHQQVSENQLKMISDELNVLDYYCIDFQAHYGFIFFQNSEKKMTVHVHKRKKSNVNLDPDLDPKIGDVPYSKFHNMTIMYGKDEDYPSFVIDVTRTGTYNFIVGAFDSPKYLLVNNDNDPADSIEIKGSELNETLIESGGKKPIIFVNAQNKPYAYHITAQLGPGEYIEYVNGSDSMIQYLYNNDSATCNVNKPVTFYQINQFFYTPNGKINSSTKIVIKYNRTESTSPTESVTKLLDWYNFNQYSDLKSYNKTVTIVITSIAGGLVLIGIIVFIYYQCHVRKNNQAKEEVITQPLTAADGNAYNPQPVYAGVPQYNQPVYQQTQGIPPNQ